MTREKYEAKRMAAGLSDCSARAEAASVETAGIAYQDALHLVESFDAISGLLCQMSCCYLRM